MKHIRDQLAVTRRMLEEQLKRLAEHGGHLDDYRVLAALAETQYHLTRTLDARPAKGGEVGDDGPDGFDEKQLTCTVGDPPIELVDWPSELWECPACGGPQFHIAGAPSPAEVRPLEKKRWVLASLSADCQDCGFTSSVGTAARSWHRERAGLAPHRDVADWREANNLDNGRTR